MLKSRRLPEASAIAIAPPACFGDIVDCLLCIMLYQILGPDSTRFCSQSVLEEEGECSPQEAWSSHGGHDQDDPEKVGNSTWRSSGRAGRGRDFMTFSHEPPAAETAATAKAARRAVRKRLRFAFAIVDVLCVLAVAILSHSHVDAVDMPR